MKHYVCDACANQWDAHRATSCPACKSARLWEFPADAADRAAAYAATIRERLTPAPVAR